MSDSIDGGRRAYSPVGVCSLWGKSYRLLVCYIQLEKSESVLLIRLEEEKGNDNIHVAIAGPPQRLVKLEEAAYVDPRGVLEAAAKDEGLVAAEGPVWGLSLLGFLNAVGSRVAIQYKPGRVIVVVKPVILRKVLEVFRDNCGHHPLTRVAEEAAREAENILGCSEHNGVVYLVLNGLSG